MGDGFKTALAFLIVLVLIVGAISLVKKKTLLNPLNNIKKVKIKDTFSK